MASLVTGQSISQPQFPLAVNPYWISRGLVGCFTQCGRKMVDLLSPSQEATTNTTVQRGSISGLMNDFSGTQYIEFPNQTKYQVIGAITIIALIDIRSFTNYVQIASKEGTVSNGNVAFEFRCGLANATDPTPCFIRATASAGTFGAWGSTGHSTALGRRCLGVRATDGAVTTSPSFFENGRILGTGGFLGAGSGATADAGDILRFGRRPDGVTQMDGGIECVLLFNQALSNAESILLTTSPYYVFSNNTRRIWANLTTAMMAGIWIDLPPD